MLMWASYDDSTNAPVVYPNGTSIASVESQMLMQVTSVSLPPAHVGTAYTTQLTGTGGRGRRTPGRWRPLAGTAAAGLVLSLPIRPALRHPGGDRHLFLFRADDRRHADWRSSPFGR